jgi:orotate phosphoribosyltransferase
MEAYQRDFVDLLVDYEVIRFGDFTLKSGRKSPYFIDAGQLRSGDAIARLGHAYAEHIMRAGLACDLVFGPSYKGVPLAVSTAIAMSTRGRNIGYSFDRKEKKDHGEGGLCVGTTPRDGDKVVVVDDVTTSGRSIRDAFALLRATAAVRITGVVIAVDRQERGQGGERTTQAELMDELGVRVHAIVNIRELVDFLHGRELGGRTVVDDERHAAILRYLEAYGGRP